MSFDLPIKHGTSSSSLCVPASEPNTPHIWRPWAPGPVSLRSHRSGLAVCSWPVSPECCCRLSDPPESRPAGRASAGSGAWSPAPTVKKQSQEKSEEVRNKHLTSWKSQFNPLLLNTNEFLWQHSVRLHLTVDYTPVKLKWILPNQNHNLGYRVSSRGKFPLWCLF